MKENEEIDTTDFSDDEIEMVELSEGEENEVGGASAGSVRYINHYCQFATNNTIRLNFGSDGIQYITRVDKYPSELYYEIVGPNSINFKLRCNDRRYYNRTDMYIGALGSGRYVTYHLSCVGIGDGKGGART